jgi:uncharacterized protein
MTHATGAPCWMDLLTSDTARAREFYGRVFGWTAEEASPEFGGYFMFTLGGTPVAGCMPVQPGMNLADAWGVYLTSTDAAGTLAAAVALGATTRFEPMAVADLGVQALLDDPSGARIGIWQPVTFDGFGPVGTGRPGTPAWFQLHATDYPGSVSFYRDAFGWTPQVMGDTDDFRLAALVDGDAGTPGQPAAGIMDANAHLPAGEGARWEIYVSVDDADKTLATVSELGGTIIREAEDTPFGRFGDVRDPMGAVFNVIGRLG